MRIRILVIGMWALSACRSDNPVAGERFEINAVEEDSRSYCDDDDGGSELSFTLAGEIDVFNSEGSGGSGGEKQHTGTVSKFNLKASLTCAEGQPASIALTPIGDAGDTGKVSYKYLDNGIETDDTADLTFDDMKSATLASDPPIVHADHRLYSWFGYDDSEKLRVVLQKEEGLDDMLRDNFQVRSYILHEVIFGDGTGKTANLRLHLPEES